MRKPANRKKSEDRFPLSLHRASGQWCKRVRGKVRYFGRDKDAALYRWNAEKLYLLAGLPVPSRQPPNWTQATLSTLCESILVQKQSLAAAGQFSLRTLKDYRLATERLLDHFGPARLLADLRPVDFVAFRSILAADVSAVTCANRLRYVRAILKYTFDTELIERPIRFQKPLALPPASLMRLERRKRGALLFTTAEIHLMLNGGTVTNDSGKSVTVAGASTLMRAVILLSINAAFGSTDCAKLTFEHIDLQSGWHTFSRPKTHAERKCWLWPETVDAIREYLKIRPAPIDPTHTDRVFLTQHGGELVAVTDSHSGTGPRINVIDYVAKSFSKLLKRLNIKRKQIGFYTLRRSHRTVAAELSRDQQAADHIMGHVPPPSVMSVLYIQSISDERLKAVSISIRGWLFGPTGN